MENNRALDRQVPNASSVSSSSDRWGQAGWLLWDNIYEKASLAWSIAGDLGFLTLIQSGDRPPW